MASAQEATPGKIILDATSGNTGMLMPGLEQRVARVKLALITTPAKNASES